jgi:hypothetical protein
MKSMFGAILAGAMLMTGAPALAASGDRTAPAQTAPPRPRRRPPWTSVWAAACCW